MVFLYLSTVIPSIWFLELSLLQSKLPVHNSSGPELHLLTHIPITAVGVPSQIEKKKKLALFSPHPLLTAMRGSLDIRLELNPTDTTGNY